MTRMNGYYISKVIAPDTCETVGYVVKDSKTKLAVQSPPVVFRTLAKAEAYLRGLTFSKGAK